MKVLDNAYKLLPLANWWIKADGVDVISGLEESIRLNWNGDVDLGDGKTRRLYEEYRSRLKMTAHLNLALGTMESGNECLPLLVAIRGAICNNLENISTCKC